MPVFEGCFALLFDSVLVRVVILYIDSRVELEL